MLVDISAQAGNLKGNSCSVYRVCLSTLPQNTMEAQVAAALEVSDYKQVTRLLKQWQATDPQNPMLRLYAGQLQERTNRLDAAEKNYLKLLKQMPGSKIMSQARAGLQRIQQQQKAEKATALAEAKQMDGGKDLAILAIASPPEANRQQAIDGFSKVFELDAYTARQKVPTGGFRILRISSWGEVGYLGKALKQAQTPTFSVKVGDIQTLQTFQVCYFESVSPQLSVICKSVDGQLGKITFAASEVTQRVSGQLPIFEQVIDLGPRGRTVHKEKVQDYAQVVDLHLLGRKIVLRMCDRLYQYKKGVSLSDTTEINSRILWNQLLTQLNASISGPHHSDFTRFGKSALEFIPVLPHIPANLDIVRRGPSHWDLAFHLYSSLCYFHS